jgi:arsenate reductase (glutaredoxin)
MAFVQAIVRAYALRGMDATHVLRQAQIAPEEVADPQARITAWQMEALCEGAMRELDDEALGWFTRRLPWGSYGMLARASITAPHLGVALARWCRHHGLLTDSIALTLTTEGATAQVTLQERDPPGGDGALREFCLVSVLRNLHGVACWLIDSRLPLQEARFPFAAPAHAGVYPLLFPGPVTFGAPHAAIRFDARYLQLPLARDETALRQLLQLLGMESPRELMRQKEELYKSLNLADPALSNAALIQAMVDNPKLIERPIVVSRGQARIGRPPEQVLEIVS